MDAIAWTVLAVLFAANALVARKAWRCKRLRPRARVALVAAVWLLPVFGAAWALLATEALSAPRVRIVWVSHGARGARAGAGAAWAHAGVVIDSVHAGRSHVGGDSGACHGGDAGGSHCGSDCSSGGDCGGGDSGGGCH